MIMRTHSFLGAAILALAGAILIVAPCVAAQAPASEAKPAENSAITIDQGLSLKEAQNPRISPDGHFVAYEVREADWEENSFVKQIWIANIATGERYQLTRGKKSSASPRWSPDSARLGFLSDRDGKDQIYLIHPSGGEAETLTRVENGVSSFEWAPDGRRIAFTAEDAESKAQKDRKQKYGEYVVVKRDFTMTHLWMIDIPAEGAAKTPEPQRLTEGDQFTVSEFSWSPDSTRIAFSAQRDPNPGSGSTADIYVVSVSDKSLKKIVA